MKNPEPVSLSDVPTLETSSVLQNDRKGLIAWLLNALYTSRSREARRVIHRYRYLLAEDTRGRPASVVSTAVQPRECNANADRDKTPLRAIHRKLEDA